MIVVVKIKIISVQIVIVKLVRILHVVVQVKLNEKKSFIKYSKYEGRKGEKTFSFFGLRTLKKMDGEIYIVRQKRPFFGLVLCVM